MLSEAWEYTSSDRFLHCLPLHHILLIFGSVLSVYNDMFVLKVMDTTLHLCWSILDFQKRSHVHGMFNVLLAPLFVGASVRSSRFQFLGVS